MACAVPFGKPIHTAEWQKLWKPIPQQIFFSIVNLRNTVSVKCCWQIYIYPILRDILLSFGYSGRFYKAGFSLCPEWIPGTGFCPWNREFTDWTAWSISRRRNTDPLRPGLSLYQLPFHPDRERCWTSPVDVPRGNCWDNAPQENFFGHMKDEIDLSGYERFKQVQVDYIK